MVSVEVRNSTTASAAYETTSTAPAAREQDSTGVFNAQNEWENLADQNHGNGPYDDYDDAEYYYSESDSSTPDWSKHGVTGDTVENSDERLEALDEYRDILETTEQIYNGEVAASRWKKRKLGKRALILAKNSNIYPLQVENLLLHVEAIDPTLKKDVYDFVKKLNYDQGRSVPADVRDLALDTIDNTAEIAENPEVLQSIDSDADTIPLLRVIEAATNKTTTPRINNIVRAKETKAQETEKEVA